MEGEGTFERFLVDLQAELRVALGARPSATEPASVPVTAATSAEGEPEGEGQGESEREGEDAGVEGEDADADGVPKEGESDTHAHASTSASTTHHVPQPESRSDVQEPAPPELALPPPTVTTTESTPPRGSPTATSTSAAPAPPTAIPGAVNWWRLYRFPPIVASAAGRGGMPVAVPTTAPTAPSSSDSRSSEESAQGSQSSEEGESQSSSSEGTTPSESASSSPHPDTNSSSATPAPALAFESSPSSSSSPPPPAPPPTEGQIVVPVIVVGLQSVALGAAMGMGLFGGGLGGAGNAPHMPQTQHVPPGQQDEPPSVDIEIGAEEGVSAEAGTNDVGSQTPTQVDVDAGFPSPVTPESERRARRRSWWRPDVIGAPLRGVRAIGAGMGMGRRAEVGGASTSVSAAEAAPEEVEAAEEVEGGATSGEAAAVPVPVPVPTEASAGTGVGVGVAGNVTGGVGGAGTDASRTFLIYVIGGYYPPEHGILNGAGGAESLEALFRELPELLGYAARAPTASKADIARSGLAVISPAALPEAERAGRVVANCVERCLICLDEYDLADEIRVLSCRHAFHLGCVDRWLEEGRNNCPACRTKGVSTDPLAPVPAAHA
ncbi:hypothetical protein B0H12DRAFT_1142133 [Mycena haematopus]|nr:hypothetical protein B0H12DRAFT_1142133 [Mycena haematopus]